MTNNAAFNSVKLNDSGNLPAQACIDGVFHWLYRIVETVQIDDGTGSTSSVTIFEEKAYLKGNKEAQEWFENHPRHYSKRNDYPSVYVHGMNRNGAWCSIY